MAMIFMDGFDYYNSSQINRKWDSSNAASFVTGVYGNGKAIQGPNSWVKNLGANVVTGFMGFHFFVPAGFGAMTICAFRDAGTVQVDLRLTASGTLQLTRNGTVLGTSTSILSGNTWYWIEVKVTIDPTAGVAEVRVNGISTGWITLSGQNTRASANSYFNQVALPGSTATYDSFHVWDTTGTINNTYIGEHAISTLFPNGAGTHTDWTKSGGTANFSRVNENPADDDTSYNFSNTPGNIDSYAFGDLVPTAGSVAAVAINTVDRVDDASPHVIHH